MAAGLLFHSDYDWDYLTVPQKHSMQGMKEQRGYWPRGKVLGGTSNLNAMLYIRGNHHDYDNWAKAGAEGPKKHLEELGIPVKSDLPVDP
nr:hypothetical protein BaRGS_001312 [Batillaria attramentaria]